MRRLGVWMVWVALGAACDGSSGGDAGAQPDSGADGGRRADGGERADGGLETDGAVDAGGDDAGSSTAAWIDEVLRDCTRQGIAGRTGAGTALARIDVDLDVFPDARCVDGTGAVFFVRRAVDPAAAGRWIIQLQGGGSCIDGQSCAERWCRVDTNFGADKMSSRFAPEQGTNAGGILANRPENPFAGWNQIFIHYCSSDVWSGRQREVEMSAAHPVTGAPVTFRARFLGQSILDAVVATLRRDGVGPVRYVGPEGVERTLPDLDDADEVVLAGASAGGAGTIFNLDRFASRLREHNTSCTGAECALRVWGVIDSIYSVRLDRLDFSESALCTERGTCTWDAHQRMDYETKRSVWAATFDDTCSSWHAEHASGDGFRCADSNFVVDNHVTTPFVMRMGLTDQLIGANAAERGFTVPERDGAPLTLGLFAELVSEQLLALPDLATTAHERAGVTVAPGVYGPACPQHETLSSGPAYYDVRVVDGEAEIAFVDVLSAWRAGGSPTVAVSRPGGSPPICP